MIFKNNLELNLTNEVYVWYMRTLLNKVKPKVSVYTHAEVRFYENVIAQLIEIKFKEHKLNTDMCKEYAKIENFHYIDKKGRENHGKFFKQMQKEFYDQGFYLVDRTGGNHNGLNIIISPGYIRPEELIKDHDLNFIPNCEEHQKRFRQLKYGIFSFLFK